MARYQVLSNGAYTDRMHPQGSEIEIPDDVRPSRFFRPLDEAAIAACRREKKRWKGAPPPFAGDIDDPKDVAKHQRAVQRYMVEQESERNWFGQAQPVPRADPSQPMTLSLSGMAASAGKSVRVSDQPV